MHFSLRLWLFCSILQVFHSVSWNFTWFYWEILGRCFWSCLPGCLPYWEDPHLESHSRGSGFFDANGVMIGTGIPTACALMTLFWKDMRVQSLKGSIKQKHQQIMDGFMDGLWMDLGGVHDFEKNIPNKNWPDRVFRVGPGDFRLDKKWDVKKTTCTAVFADSSGEIHIDYHTFTYGRPASTPA